MKNSVLAAVLTAFLVGASWAASAPAPTRVSPARPTRAGANAALMTARKALFEASQLDAARTQIRALLRQKPAAVEAAFLEMEAAALEADTGGELQAALQLCELRGAAQRDPRVTIAAARLLNLAANTEEFRPVVPRLQALLARRAGYTHAQANYLRAALVAAAADGVPGIPLRQAAREAGLVTEWRIAGPFGKYSNLDFDREWAPERDRLANGASEGHAVERVRFDDGTFLLPEYFSRTGVFYAAAELTTGAGTWIVRAESAGTLAVFVDGASVLRKDERFRSAPDVAWHAVRLRAGLHRVLVKFIPSALPFRIALLPAAATAGGARLPVIAYAPEARYVQAARKYWEGDYQGAIADLNQGPHSALADYLAYQAWDRLAEDSPETGSLLDAAVKASPTALAAEYELAARAYQAERIEEALSRLQRVLAARPNFDPAQQLMSNIAIHLHWTAEAVRALEIHIRLRPNCKALREAQRFFTSHARYERGEELNKELENCAPDALAYAQSLSESGQHAQAAAAAGRVIANQPLDRSARELHVRELSLAGKTAEAAEAARQLAALAPNSARYRRLAQAAANNPDELLDEPGARESELGEDATFYSPYRRDGVAMVRQTAERRFSGGPALMLLNDRVARLGADGRVAVYVHKLTRMLDRDGINRYGEVELPHGAEVLELRTIKADGTVAEPEFNQQKASISMPGLAPGDAIDQEYVIRYADGEGTSGHDNVFQHTFGSFRAPTLYSRFVVITPPGDGVRITTSGGVAPAKIEARIGAQARVWEKNDIPQSVEEVASARGDILPTVRVEPVLREGWREVREHDANLLMDAVRISARVNEAAQQVRAQQPQAKAREIYRMVVSSIRPREFRLDDMPSAEETLAAHSGSRTAALLAIARAAGLDAELVLARNAGGVTGPSKPRMAPLLSAYTRPLVRFRFDEGQGRSSEMVVDAETEGLAFGALPPGIERGDALLVNLPREGDTVAEAPVPLMALPPSAASEQSAATADVRLHADGDLSAQISIVLGSWRAAQMRSILAGIEPAQRPHFFQQLAARIFAGAESVTGEARNEQKLDQPLEVVLQCRSPHFVNLAGGQADIDQLVPALGLKKMYVGGSSRKFPLYIDTPLFETATFRLHLPSGTSVLRPLASMNASTRFGGYSLFFREIAPQELEITRSFNIPVQVIPPERFSEFARFAAQIDDAERQRITLVETSL